ncbi:YggT family protein [Komagataeibacter sp. NFXK3]
MKVGPLISIIFNLLAELIQLYTYVVLVSCLFSFLLAFGILDQRNQVVWNIGNFLYRMTEPVLRPIRSVLPNFGNMDFSPLVLLLLIQYLALPLLWQVRYMLLTALS